MRYEVKPYIGGGFIVYDTERLMKVDWADTEADAEVSCRKFNKILYPWI